MDRMDPVERFRETVFSAEETRREQQGLLRSAPRVPETNRTDPEVPKWVAARKEELQGLINKVELQRIELNARTKAHVALVVPWLDEHLLKMQRQRLVRELETLENTWLAEYSLARGGLRADNWEESFRHQSNKFYENAKKDIADWDERWVPFPWEESLPTLPEQVLKPLADQEDTGAQKREPEVIEIDTTVEMSLSESPIKQAHPPQRLTDNISHLETPTSILATKQNSQSIDLTYFEPDDLPDVSILEENNYDDHEDTEKYLEQEFEDMEDMEDMDAFDDMDDADDIEDMGLSDHFDMDETSFDQPVDFEQTHYEETNTNSALEPQASGFISGLDYEKLLEEGLPSPLKATQSPEMQPQLEGDAPEVIDLDQESDGLENQAEDDHLTNSNTLSSNNVLTIPIKDTDTPLPSNIMDVESYSPYESEHHDSYGVVDDADLVDYEHRDYNDPQSLASQALELLSPEPIFAADDVPEQQEEDADIQDGYGQSDEADNTVIHTEPPIAKRIDFGFDITADFDASDPESVIKTENVEEKVSNDDISVQSAGNEETNDQEPELSPPKPSSTKAEPLGYQEVSMHDMDVSFNIIPDFNEPDPGPGILDKPPEPAGNAYTPASLIRSAAKLFGKSALFGGKTPDPVVNSTPTTQRVDPQTMSASAKRLLSQAPIFGGKAPIKQPEFSVTVPQLDSITKARFKMGSTEHAMFVHPVVVDGISDHLEGELNSFRKIQSPENHSKDSDEPSSTPEKMHTQFIGSVSPSLSPNVPPETLSASCANNPLGNVPVLVPEPGPERADTILDSSVPESGPDSAPEEDQPQLRRSPRKLPTTIPGARSSSPSKRSRSPSKRKNSGRVPSKGSNPVIAEELPAPEVSVDHMPVPLPENGPLNVKRTRNKPGKRSADTEETSEPKKIKKGKNETQAQEDTNRTLRRSGRLQKK